MSDWCHFIDVNGVVRCVPGRRLNPSQEWLVDQEKLEKKWLEQENKWLEQESLVERFFLDEE